MYYLNFPCKLHFFFFSFLFHSKDCDAAAPDDEFRFKNKNIIWQSIYLLIKNSNNKKSINLTFYVDFNSSLCFVIQQNEIKKRMNKWKVIYLHFEFFYRKNKKKEE